MSTIMRKSSFFSQKFRASNPGKGAPIYRYSSSHLVSYNEGFSGLQEKICFPIFRLCGHIYPPPYSMYCAPEPVWRNWLFFLSGRSLGEKGWWLVITGHIQSKWCEKTMRGILTCFFVSISFVSFHYGIHHHWLGPSLLIPIEILPPVIPCYFIISTGGERYRGKCYT